MRLREEGLDTLFQLVKTAKDSLGVKVFIRTPGSVIDPDPDKLPTVFMLEGLDTIIQRNSRGRTGYPAKRDFDITLEIVTTDNYDIKKLYRDLRTVVLVNGGLVAEKTFIREGRTDGPSGYDIPGIQGMRMHLIMRYIDFGD